MYEPANNGGAASTNGGDGSVTISYLEPAPSVLAVSPSSGSAEGGTPVTITGEGFVAGAGVSIGSAPCADAAVQSATTITCTTGPGDVGSADVVVTNPDEQTSELPGAFTYATNAALPQTLVRCGKAPKANQVNPNGRTRLTKAGCTTNADQRVRVKASQTARGDVRLFRVIKKPNGKVVLRTFGERVNIRVTWSARANESFEAYKKSRIYKVR